MDLISERKREILFAVVENYIASAEPVGSLHVSKIKGIDLSPATIRHVMSELEELGYLSRPHTSAGGIPTHLAYRFYVDRLNKLNPLTADEKEEVQDLVKNGSVTMNEILLKVCHWISEQANQPGLALLPRPEERMLRHIQFVRLKDQLALAVLVSSAGLVENKVLKLDQPYSQDQLNRMHNYLNEKIMGRTVGELRQEILKEMKNANEQYDTLLAHALILGEQALSEAPRDLHIEGSSRLLSDPEFSNIEKMQTVLRALEQKTGILKLLDQSLKNPGVRIFIGEEVNTPEVNGLSLITSTYSDNEGNRGVLGVLGPSRMNYASLVPLVDFTSRALTEALEGIAG